MTILSKMFERIAAALPEKGHKVEEGDGLPLETTSHTLEPDFPDLPVSTASVIACHLSAA
jgi:hypothetical protein